MPRVAARAVATSCCWPMVRIGQQCAGRQLEAEIVEQPSDLRAPWRRCCKRPNAGLLVAEEKIRGDGQMRAEHDLLMHGVDAESDRLVRRRESDGSPLPEDLAAAARI